MKKALTMTAAVVLSVTAVSSYNDSYATKESYMTQLSEIEDEQSKVNSQLSDAESELDKEKDNLASINTDYASVRKQIEQSQAEIERLEKQIADADQKRCETQDSIDKKTADKSCST